MNDNNTPLLPPGLPDQIPLAGIIIFDNDGYHPACYCGRPSTGALCFERQDARFFKHLIWPVCERCGNEVAREMEEKRTAHSASAMNAGVDQHA